MTVVAWLWMSGCGADAPPTPEAPPAATASDFLGLGWVAEAVLDPSSFATMTERSRDGWVAMHANDLRGAYAKFADDRVGRARAAFALAVVYDDLSRLCGVANERLFTEWSSRGDLPPGYHAPLVAALAAHCSGGENAGIWATKVTEGPELALALAMAQGRSPLDVDSNGPYGRRFAMHRNARNANDADVLMDAALSPIVSEPAKDFTREYWDPCLYRTLSELWTDRVGREVGGNGWRAVASFSDPKLGLGSVFLAPWPSASDLKMELTTASHPGELGAHSPTLRRAGVGTETYASDDAESARAEVRNLDVTLDGWLEKLDASASADGKALLHDLGLAAKYRQEWLVVRGRAALGDQHPNQALAYLEQARDHTTNRIGVENSASVFVLIAEAHLRLGHTREALSVVHILTDGYNETYGLRETLADLAVLQGLDRNGDSKEE